MSRTLTPDNWFRTRSPERAIHLCESAFHSHKLALLGPSDGFGFSQRLIHAGPVTLADLIYDTDVSLRFSEGRDSYYVHVPIEGRLESQYLGQRWVSTPATATIYGPEAEMSVTRWPGASRHLGVKIDQLVVDAALETLLGHPARPSVPFAVTLPLADRAARSWVAQAHWLSRELAHSDSPMRHPAVLDPLVESLVYGLLLVADHPQREALSSSVRPIAPAAVREAMDIIESTPQSALTTSRLALDCHVSVRALQEGFRRHVGMSPMAYLRAVRLRRAHGELRSAHPSHTGVATIAHRWGFAHLGRFAAAYKAMYGESPQQTLRGAR
ncbi:AraC family transcriptional regulator [Mycobacterium sp. E796]|uniref:AraC family transcriptional regulator n=1 Tax=Mycobacterium sp. E796 TaxID=1834151 RepID=UPI0009EF4191|nr:AraC family transcriptional regulator [Mycobacterium sp. E796]